MAARKNTKPAARKNTKPAAHKATTAKPKPAARKATGKLSTRQAIEKVLTGKRGSMTVSEIAEAGIPLTGLSGATPKQTFYSTLYAESKKATGIVQKVGRGQFKLNAKRVTTLT